MCLTHKLSCAAIGLLFLTGCSSAPRQTATADYHDFRQTIINCQRPSQHRFDAIQADPPADEAASVRVWEAQTDLYPSGATLAYPTYHLNDEERRGWAANDYWYSVAAPGLVVFETFAMPFNMIIDPPTNAVVYHGVHLPPSMTVAPPMAPVR
jgi:hypothetical protein